MGLASAVDAAAAAAEAAMAHRNPQITPGQAGDIRAAARAASVAANVILSSPGRARPHATRVGGRRQSTGMSPATKLQIIPWKESGNSWEWMGMQLHDQYAKSILRSVYRSRAVVRARLAVGTSNSSHSSKASCFADVDSRLSQWFEAVEALSRKRISLSLSVLRTKAMQIAESLGVVAFSASNAFLQNWARRHGPVNLAFHGAKASANIEEAAERMVGIRRQLETNPPRQSKLPYGD